MGNGLCNFSYSAKLSIVSLWRRSFLLHTKCLIYVLAPFYQGKFKSVWLSVLVFNTLKNLEKNTPYHVHTISQAPLKKGILYFFAV